MNPVYSIPQGSIPTVGASRSGQNTQPPGQTGPPTHAVPSGPPGPIGQSGPSNVIAPPSSAARLGPPGLANLSGQVPPGPVSAPASGDQSVPMVEEHDFGNFFAEVPLDTKDRKVVETVNELLRGYDDLFEFLRKTCQENGIDHDRDSLHSLAEHLKQQFFELLEVPIHSSIRVNYEGLKVKAFINDFRHFLQLCSNCRESAPVAFCTCREYKLCEHCITVREESESCNQCNDKITYERIEDSSLRRRVQQQMLQNTNKAACCKCNQEFLREGGTYRCENCEDFTCPQCFKQDVLEMMPHEPSEPIRYLCHSCHKLSQPMPIVGWTETCRCSQGRHDITKFLPVKCQGEYHCYELWRRNLEQDQCVVHFQDLTVEQVFRAIGWFLIECGACKLISYADANSLCQYCRETICAACWKGTRTSDGSQCPSCGQLAPQSSIQI